MLSLTDETFKVTRSSGVEGNADITMHDWYVNTQETYATQHDSS
jgi:hypothetical protein